MTRLTFAQARRVGLVQKKGGGHKRLFKTSRAVWDCKKIPGGILFIIPENMPSLNVWKRWHWAEQDRYLKELTENLKMLAISAGLPTMEKAKVEVTHYFRANNKHDKDNYTPKQILDSLRYARVIAEDNAEVLELPEPVFKIDREAWRTEIRVIQK